MENLSMPEKKSKQDLEYKGGKINLGMIENVWRDSYLGVNYLRETKLTEDHFHKNAQSRMRVHLSAQILSNTVIDMLHKNLNDNQIKQYSSLISAITQLNNAIDIWNHPKSKRFLGNKSFEQYSNIKNETGKVIEDHPYLKYLINVLKWFSEWRAETKKNIQNKVYPKHFV